MLKASCFNIKADKAVLCLVFLVIGKETYFCTLLHLLTVTLFLFHNGRKVKWHQSDAAANNCEKRCEKMCYVAYFQVVENNVGEYI